MADRSAARVFGFVFRTLAKRAGREVMGDALEFWCKTFDYDFTPEQMGADDALMALGLARQRVEVETTGEREGGVSFGVQYAEPDGSFKP